MTSSGGGGGVDNYTACVGSGGGDGSACGGDSGVTSKKHNWR